MNNIQFCPKCGKTAEELYNKVCKECLLESFHLLEAPAVTSIKVCPKCGSFLKRGKWIKPAEPEEIEDKDAAVDAAFSVLNVNKDVADLTIETQAKKMDSSRFLIRISARASYSGMPVSEERDIEVRMRRETCETCSRIAGGYYEGIIQIRAENRSPSKYELEKCLQLAYEVTQKAADKGDGLVFISKIEELKEGTDIYIGSVKLGKKICNRIIEEFGGGSFTESPKLVGKKDGRDIYRVTFAMRLPEFIRGDFIEVDGRIFDLTSSEKGLDIETGASAIINAGMRKRAKKVGRLEDAVTTVITSVEGDVVQILDPASYQTVLIKKPAFLEAEAGSEIKVIRMKDDRIFAVS